MILKVGEYGIKAIKNTLTHEEFNGIIVYQRMVINGIPAINEPNFDDPILHLGMNVDIHFETKEQAAKMLDMVNIILTKGDETDVTVEATLLGK